MGRSTGPASAVVDLVWERDGGSCARCGTGLSFAQRGVAWSVHHRRPRGMGGTKQAWVNQPANLVTLCGSGTTGCHGWIESNRADARLLGWLIPLNGVQTAEQIGVTYWDGTLRYLNDEGGWTDG